MLYTLFCVFSARTLHLIAFLPFHLPPNHCTACPPLIKPMGLAAAQCAVGCRCARKVFTGKFGPTGPQHSLKCQIVFLTREKFGVWKKVKRGKTGREREGCKITRKSTVNRTGLRGNSGGLNEGMPKRRADIRQEHQTWVRGKREIRQRGSDGIHADVGSYTESEWAAF